MGFGVYAWGFVVDLASFYCFGCLMLWFECVVAVWELRFWGV